MTQEPASRRVLLKLSGEALMGDGEHGICPNFIADLAQELKAIHALGIQMGIVIGGGNIFRGVAGASQGMERTSADQMGMLATVMNSLALRDALANGAQVPATVMSALEMPRVADTFTQRQADQLLSAGSVVIFAAGTGNPFFTTDTAAALRAAEIGADLLIKGTKVDGVYDDDPVKNPQAIRYSKLTMDDVLQRRLRVMDQTAITLCRENSISISVCSILQRGDLTALLKGDQSKGTLIEVG